MENALAVGFQTYPDAPFPCGRGDRLNFVLTFRFDA
jgi:hypothetical protein